MISEYLRQGEANAIKSDELCSITGYDKRTLLRMIETERDQGEMICANQGGYFLAENEQEISDFYTRYTRTAKKMLYTARHFKKAMQTPKGQVSLF